jgi:hypothetical protein
VKRNIFGKYLGVSFVRIESELWDVNITSYCTERFSFKPGVCVCVYAFISDRLVAG